MNNTRILSILATFLFISCSSDDTIEKVPVNKNPGAFSASVSSINESSALIQWEASIDPDNNTVTYTILLNGAEIKSNISTTEYQLEDLSESTSYNGSIIATDGQGGTRSTSFTFTTEDIVIVPEGVSIAWQKSYGGSANDEAPVIRPTNDGGYILAGTSESIDGDITNPIGDKDAWILKLNSEGEIEWEKTIGGSGQDSIHDIQVTNDGGYIVGAFSTSTDLPSAGNLGMRDFWIVKLSSSGTIEWDRNIGGSRDDILESIIQTSNGDYVAVGFSLSPDLNFANNKGNGDGYIVKLNASGDFLWNYTFGSTKNDLISSIQETNDTGYILSGYTTNDNKRDAWILKLNSDGISEWEKTYVGLENEEAISIEKTSDNGYIIGGYTRSDMGGQINNGGFDGWMMKIDVEGNMLWQKVFGGSGNEGINSIVETSDQGYVAVGTSSTADGDIEQNNGAVDLWVFKTDPSGNIQWQENLGSSGDDYGTSFAIDQNNAIVVAGSWYTNIIDQGEGSSGDFNFWVLKLEE